MRVFALFSLLFVAAIADYAYFCEIKTPLNASLVPQIALAGQNYGWGNFNAISFNSFGATSGDVEGRLAVRNNLNLPNGQYSVGYELRTGGVSSLDIHLPFSVVVGHNANWLSGAILPDGTNFPYTGLAEGAYVGGTFTGASDLAARVTGSSGVLDASFDNAQSYFIALSNAFAQVADNANLAVQYSGVTITCLDSSLFAYSATVDAALFSTVTYYTVSNCNLNAQLVINIVGSGDVTFSGDNLRGFQNERVVYNVVGNGRTVNVETEVDGSILAPNCTFNQHNSGVVKGLLVVGDAQNVLQINRLNCQPPATPVTPNPCVGFETTCAGLTGTLNGDAFSFTNYNAISFGGYVATTSDVQGRLAAAGNVVLGAGFSIGATLSTVNNIPDASQDFSLIVGGNLTWTSGELFPSGATGMSENAYVVGSASVPADIDARVTQGSDLSSVFAAARTCYEGYSAVMAAKQDNVATSIYWSGLFVTCSDNTLDQYVVSLTDSQFTSFTYAVLDNCNFQARWIINVRGSGDVTFTGASFPTIPGATVYNVIGARTVNVHDTSLGGHLLAPDATLNQVSGVIVGKVVVADVVSSWQINSMSTCPDETQILYQIIASGSANAGDYSVAVAGASGLRVNDITSLGQITDINNDVVTFSNPFQSSISSGTNIGNVYISSLSGRAVASKDSSSSASVAGVAFAVVAVAALLL